MHFCVNLPDPRHTPTQNATLQTRHRHNNRNRTEISIFCDPCPQGGELTVFLPWNQTLSCSHLINPLLQRWASPLHLGTTEVGAPLRGSNFFCHTLLSCIPPEAKRRKRMKCWEALLQDRTWQRIESGTKKMQTTENPQGHQTISNLLLSPKIDLCSSTFDAFC